MSGAFYPVKILVAFSHHKASILQELKEALVKGYAIALFNPALRMHKEFWKRWNPNLQEKDYWYLEWENSPIKDLPQESSLILCTSGTTGRIREVVLTKKASLFNVRSLSSYLGMEGKYKVLGLPPLYHAFGFNLCFFHSLVKGYDYIPVEKFSSEHLENCLNEEDQFFIPLVPQMIDKISFDTMENVKGITVTGGDVVSEHHIRKLNNLFPSMKHTVGYGMTEAGPAITHTSPLKETSSGFIGSPLPQIKLKIEKGILNFHSPGQASWINDGFRGWENVEDSYISTGDFVQFSENGYSFRSRSKDIIKHNSETLFPREIENYIDARMPFHLNLRLSLLDDKLVLLYEKPLTPKEKKLLYEVVQSLPSIYRPSRVERCSFNRNALGKIVA